MERREAFQKIAFLSAIPALAPLVAGKTEKDLDHIKISQGKKLAIDAACISDVGILKGGKKLTAREIMEIYFETGVLIYHKTASMGPDYQPVTVIES